MSGGIGLSGVYVFIGISVSAVIEIVGVGGSGVFSCEGRRV